MPRPFEMLFLITYDIASDRPGDRRRARVAKFLESRGLRVQGSVFEVSMAPEKLPALIEDLRERIKESEDSIRFYPICSSCAGRQQKLGIDAVIEHDTFLVW